MKQLGAKITRDLTDRYARSSNWHQNRFHNPEETKMNIPVKAIPKLLYQQFTGSGRNPKEKIPITPLDPESFNGQQEAPRFVWYGHSVLLINVRGKTILIDPMFGHNASPIAAFGAKRFSENTLDLIDALPVIDLVLLTHDHYDHLDFTSIGRLKSKVKQYYTALGVGRHLKYWGVEQDKIKEFDWWDHHTWEGIEITFTPGRHFSGRGIRDRFRSLWGGWVINTADQRIYFSGDSGYGEHFKEVGDRLGPFDIGFMECGQYNRNWHQIHMFPEESVQASLDSGVRRAMAVHWGGFALALHHWKDPIERFTREASRKNLAICTPEIGEVFNITHPPETSWWQDLE